MKNIYNMFALLKENEEVVKSTGVEGVCMIMSKNDVLHFSEFGSLKGVSKNPSIFRLIMGHSKLDNVKQESIQDLRDKVIAKMSKIAKSQLDLNQFPYERARKGEVIIHVIPQSSMFLQPPGRLATKDLKSLTVKLQSPEHHQ